MVISDADNAAFSEIGQTCIFDAWLADRCGRRCWRGRNQLVSQADSERSRLPHQSHRLGGEHGARVASAAMPGHLHGGQEGRAPTASPARSAPAASRSACSWCAAKRREIGLGRADDASPPRLPRPSIEVAGGPVPGRPGSCTALPCMRRTRPGDVQPNRLGVFALLRGR